jgi:RIO kinase 1
VTELEIALEDLTQKKFPVTPVRELKSGKEAKVYIVVAENDNELYALKVYHDYRSRSFQTQTSYMQDRYVGAENASIRRAIRKGNDVGRGFIQATWVMREQYFLKKISDQTPYIPKLIKPTKNGVLMEYIGNENGAAPRMSEVTIPDELVEPTVGILLDLAELFLVNGIIHGDFSPFNILWWKNRPIVIDFPQAVDVRETKRVYSLLKRDILNVMKPYGYDIDAVESVTQEMLERNALPGFDG